MANAVKEATLYRRHTSEVKAKATLRASVGTELTDGYEILDSISINHKIPFEELLKIITDSILESIGAFHVRKIYLFGSHAYGKPNKYSDIDLCVVISNKLNRSKAYFNISKGLDNKKIVSLDILVYNEREFNEKKDRAGIVRTIYRKGRSLYG
jgi:predicted nucleotidyltransferase